MKRKYVIYYRFSSTQSCPQQELHSFVQSYCQDGEIVGEVNETDIGRKRIDLIKQAVDTAREEKATLVIAELNNLDSELSFYTIV